MSGDGKGGVNNDADGRGLLDRLIERADDALRTLCAPTARGARPHPAEGIGEADLSDEERALSARLMRVNHAGEIAAQGLYHGQALVARGAHTRARMLQNAHEEADHLHWCKKRIEELGGRTSFLAPMWYAGSFAIGAAAGLFGDRWNLGFVKETEEQVVAHLQSHLARAPSRDRATLAIIEQIKRDEAEHARAAEREGAGELPKCAKQGMRIGAKVMTTGAWWV